MDTPIRKVSIKLPNGAEFIMEGPEAEVKDYFAAFIAAVGANQAAPANNGGQNSGQVDASKRNTPDGLDEATMQRLFALDDYAGVSLRAKPVGDNAEGNALIALLYGFAKLLNAPNPSAVMLMRAAVKSGIQVARLDRALKAQSGFVTSSGKAKGVRYGLNNPGLMRAEEILREILG